MRECHQQDKPTVAVIVTLALAALAAYTLSSPLGAQEPADDDLMPAVDTSAAPAVEEAPADPVAEPDAGIVDVAPAEPVEPTSPEEFRSLDHEVQALKDEVLALNRDLFLLEEELLFPANTQVSVFLSMDVGTFFALDSVQLKLDDREVTNYLYTDREVTALHRGGVHRLYLGNVKAGEHELVAVFTGGGPHNRDYKRATSVLFEKGLGAKFVELTITDSKGKMQPEFAVKEWE